MAPDRLLTPQMAHSLIPGLSVRTAQRRIAAGAERVRLGVPEPGDEDIQFVGRNFGAPLHWWRANVQRHPLKARGRPPEKRIR